MMDYAVSLATDTGIAVGYYSDFESLEWVLNVNRPAALVWTVAGVDLGEVLAVDMRLFVYRGIDLLGGTVFFVQKWRIENDPNNPRVIVYAESALTLLNRRIVAAAAGSAGAEKTGYADDLIKQIVRESLGASAGTGRDISAYLAIDADTSAGGVAITAAFSRKNVLTVANDLGELSKTAGGSRVFFDVLAVGPAGLRFVTFAGVRGVDRAVGSASPFSLSAELGQLENVIFVADYSDSANYVYAGGSGEGADRLIAEMSDSSAINLSVFNRREIFKDARNVSTAAALSSAGAAALYDATARDVVRATLIDSTAARFGVDWGLGDRVGVVINRVVYDADILQVRGKIAAGNETVSAGLEVVI